MAQSVVNDVHLKSCFSVKGRKWEERGSRSWPEEGAKKDAHLEKVQCLGLPGKACLLVEWDCWHGFMDLDGEQWDLVSSYIAAYSVFLPLNCWPSWFCECFCNPLGLGIKLFLCACKLGSPFPTFPLVGGEGSEFILHAVLEAQSVMLHTMVTLTSKQFTLMTHLLFLLHSQGVLSRCERISPWASDRKLLPQAHAWGGALCHPHVHQSIVTQSMPGHG